MRYRRAAGTFSTDAFAEVAGPVLPCGQYARRSPSGTAIHPAFGSTGMPASTAGGGGGGGGGVGSVGGGGGSTGGGGGGVSGPPAPGGGNVDGNSPIADGEYEIAVTPSRADGPKCGAVSVAVGASAVALAR